MGDYPPQYYSAKGRKYYHKRPSVAGGGGGGSSIGGWVELGRTTLESAGDTITVSNLADKRYYMILSSEIKSGTNSTPFIRFNNDSASNYSRRYHVLGGEYTNTSVDNIGMNVSSASGHQFQVSYFANYSSKEKLGIIHAVSQQTAGSGNSPDRNEIATKWTNTTNAINRVDVINADSGTGDFASGSEVVVLGWDSADTHTTNFWEELASADLSGGANSQLDSGTFTGKKYLWFQAYLDTRSSSADVYIKPNNSSSSDKSFRYSDNGASDTTFTTNPNWWAEGFYGTTPSFVNGFIINNSANEKLCICHAVQQNTAGSGNVPQRRESVMKWAYTSGQITQLVFHTGSSATYGTNSIVKVWGSD